MLKRVSGVLSLAAVFVLGTAVVAFATPPTAEEVIGDAAGTLSSSILDMVIVIAPILVGVVAVFIALNLVLRKFRGVAK